MIAPWLLTFFLVWNTTSDAELGDRACTCKGRVYYITIIIVSTTAGVSGFGKKGGWLIWFGPAQGRQMDGNDMIPFERFAFF
ncbi:hypothetical protein VTJ04DRAFT_7776 [Mycothermus thermophilus]|uniref:uncharacterized protein n=1 Tax=Humicola insolens TaxID=85995 RepID=UPI003744958F